MKKYITKLTALSLIACATFIDVQAGNKDRTGQAGATELLINPWGSSSGLFGLNVANVSGIEAMKVNIAGLAHTKNTEVGISRSEILKGTGVSTNIFGISQKIKNFGVLGFNIMSVGFGDIKVTKTNDPYSGNLGTYKPQFINASLGFAKQFSEGIYAGVGATFVSEQINTIKANGACFEAGVHYVTGKRDNFHFGVTLRNIGTNMRFSGSGFSVEAELPESTTGEVLRLSTPAEKFEMPTYLSFGASYDFYLDENRLKSEEDEPKHRLTAMAAFTSNSFLNDYIGAGLEYSFKEMFMLRGAYRYEKDMNNAETPSTFYTGLSAGATVRVPLGSKGPFMAFDYSFRPTQRPANGVHVFGIRLMTRSKAERETDDSE